MNIYEVAKRARVSIATVSRVINNSPSVRQETRERVCAVLKELNYTPNAIARSLAVNATQTIGVLASDVRDSYYATAIYTLEQAFQDLNYNLILCNTGGELEKKKQYLRVLLEKKVDGMILVGSVFKEKTGNTHILETAQKVPVIMLNCHVEGENIYSVVCDDSYATSRIVRHLSDKGHKDIVYVYDVESFSGLAKLEGYQMGMDAEGLKTHIGSIVRTDSGFAGGIHALEHLESLGHSYTALIASEDNLAAGLIKGLTLLGRRIPQDVEVFGYNNSMLTLCTTPELSSVDNKASVMAQKSAELLLKILRGDKAETQSIIIPDLVMRGSCP